MNKLKRWLAKLWQVLKSSIRRFPETIFISLILVVILIIDNHMDYDDDQVLMKLSMVLILGIFLSAAFKLIIEKFNLSLVYRAIGDMGFIVYSLIFYLQIPEDPDDVFMIRYALAMAIAIFIFTLVPYLWHRKGYGIYCVKLIVSFLITYLYTLVLYLGIIAIIFAIDFLFDLNISEKIYFDTFVAAVGLFGLTFYLGKIPAIDATIEDYKYPVVLRVLLVSIVVPLIAIYTLVLHAYLVRVIVAIGWSDAFVSQLVIWYGFVSVILMIVLYPLKDESQLVKVFYNYYPFAMIVPMVMLAISMGIRINAYGLTVPRVMVILAWLWFVGTIVYVIIGKGKLSQFIVVGFIGLFILGVYSPVNVFSISHNAQEERLTDLLVSGGILVDGKILKQASIDEASQVMISDSIDYFLKYRGLEKVSYLPVGFEVADMEEYFGFAYVNDHYYVDDFGKTYVNYYREETMMIDIVGYEYHAIVSPRYDDEAIDRVDGVNIIGEKGKIILIDEGVTLFEEDVSLLLTQEGDPFDYNEMNEPIELIFEESWGKMKLVFNEFDGTMEDGQLEVTDYEVQVYWTLDL